MTSNNLESKTKSADWEELWDEFSQYIDDDIFSLESVAGSSVMKKRDFKNAFDKFTLLEQTETVGSDSTQFTAPSQEFETWVLGKMQEWVDNTPNVEKSYPAAFTAGAAATLTAFLNPLKDRIFNLESLLRDYEQWEADIIGKNEMWWPSSAKDVLPDDIYKTMLELQAKRNELLKTQIPIT